MFTLCLDFNDCLNCQLTLSKRMLIFYWTSWKTVSSIDKEIFTQTLRLKDCWNCFFFALQSIFSISPFSNWQSHSIKKLLSPFFKKMSLLTQIIDIISLHLIRKSNKSSREKQFFRRKECRSKIEIELDPFFVVKQIAFKNICTHWRWK